MQGTFRITESPFFFESNCIPNAKQYSIAPVKNIGLLTHSNVNQNMFSP